MHVALSLMRLDSSYTKFIDPYWNEYQRWASHATYDMQYEKMYENRSAQLENIVHALQVPLAQVCNQYFV